MRVGMREMRPFIESKECDDIYAYLKSEVGRANKLLLSLTTSLDALKKRHSLISR